MSEDNHAVARCLFGLTTSIVTGFYIGASVVYHWLVQPSVQWALFFNLTWILALWSYLQTAFTDPGTRNCPEWQDWSRVREGLSKHVEEAMWLLAGLFALLRVCFP